MRPRTKPDRTGSVVSVIADVVVKVKKEMGFRGIEPLLCHQRSPSL